MDIVVNTRTLASKLTGVQRYTSEIVDRLGAGIERIAPRPALDGIAGHAWEQFVLPTQLRGRLLWSPSNTGPLLVRQQVVTVHDVVPLDHPEWLNPRFAGWYRFLLPKLLPRVRRIITVSEFSKTRILEHIRLEPWRVVVIPNGVDPRFHPRTQEEHDQIKERLGLPSSHFVLSLGSLEPRKNLGRLLKAWALVSTRLPEEVWLVVAGAKGKAQIFQEVSLEKLPPRVHFVGHVPDEYLPVLYSAASGFVYPSVYEGFGIPPLEAMASGTPTLTGNRTALPEVVGDAALTVDPFDVEAIADGLWRLVTDAELRQRLRQRGLERSKQFGWDSIAKHTWSVLQEAAAE
ncbi:MULTISPECIES: glycosyltransferase family 1 protein [unclassified Meiothermus]|uniref:glycosyltransferase family 4 protein n=1 Tax=unclassified Meiothermus TaxID=370471 RepID=UPI000D7BDC24|nr:MULTISPECIES: glycosyltransferase family 1 protein [unclassified Meiothermus]PZA06814.1 glycosyltransferase family 1 protein [Meiothermus sp. Pnk-1]RYM33095.1 glycosyltransferase family 1 protein [Meiothermus sp. PNK-Is4]